MANRNRLLSGAPLVYAVTHGITMKRIASAAWRGGLQKGAGNISTQSGVLRNAQYGFKERFEEGLGTNPEELIAAG